MIPKSRSWFSEKMMLKQPKRNADSTQHRSLWCLSAIAGAGEMGTQQRDVAAISPEENVERVAGERHCANEPFERDIGRHAREQKPRHAEPRRFVEQITGQQRGNGVADAGDEAQKRFDAEADIGAWQDEGGVERGRQHVEPVERGAAFRRIIRPGAIGETEPGEAAPECGIVGETHCGFAFGTTPQRALDGNADRARKARG